MTVKKELRHQLYDRDGRVCDYYGIEEADFTDVWGAFYGGKTRGGVLEVDRKDSTKGYEMDNCVLACAICNNAKSDKFTYEEFKAVGEVIGTIWFSKKRRLHTASDQDR